MASSMGLATCFAASNRVYGKVFDVDEAETYELAAIDEKYPKSEYFVIDVQAHFTNGIALNFRNSETARNMGFNLKDDVESYSFKNFVKEMFFDSETEHGGDLRRADARDPAHARRQSRGRRAAQSAVRDPAELADGREEERDQRNGRLAARAVPGQPRAEPLLGQGDQQHRQGRDDRADGARAAAVQDRLVEVVLPHRPGAHRQRLPARRRQRDVVLRGVAQARHEADQRAQGLLLPVAHARPPGEPEGRREGGARRIPTSTS